MSKSTSSMKVRKSGFLSVIAFFIFTVFHGVAFADSANLKFKQVGVYKDGGTTWAIIQLEGRLETYPACAEGYNHQLSFEISDDFGKLMYSTVLTAVTTKSNVWYVYSGSGCGWLGNRPKLTRIDINNE